MLDNYFSVTVTFTMTTCSPCHIRLCHSVTVCHGVFAHTYARACERTHLISIFYLIMLLTNVCKNTMTQYDSMTIPVNTRAVAVMVVSHGKCEYDTNVLNYFAAGM